MMVCRGTRTHDQHYFEHPEAITGDPPVAPFIDVRSEDIARRAISLEVLTAAFFDIRRELGDAFAAGRSTHGAFGFCGDWTATGRPAFDRWLEQHSTVVDAICTSLTRGTAHAGRAIDLAEDVRSDGFRARIDAIASDALGHRDLSEGLAAAGSSRCTACRRVSGCSTPIGLRT